MRYCCLSQVLAKKHQLTPDPIIFRGLKSLTLADSQQQTLLRLASEGISVYCPHTAVDAINGGLGDWLVDIVASSTTHSAVSDSESLSNKLSFPHNSTYSLPIYPTASQTLAHDLPHIPRSIIRPLKASCSHGMGRLVEFDEAVPLSHMIDRIGRGVGLPSGFAVAIPQKRRAEDIRIRSVGVCAGSGQDVLRHCEAELLLTGELSHHDALAATEQGKCVVCVFHSNSERGYLNSVMKENLMEMLSTEWRRVRNEHSNRLPLHTESRDAYQDEEVLVEVSKEDRDPYGMVVHGGICR